MNETDLLKESRNILRKIELFYFFKILPQIFSTPVRRTGHFQEWLSVPMNYVRVIELPITMKLLDLEKGVKILDISSPKLLSLYLGTNGYPDITVSDVEDYFAKDFEIYAKHFDFAPQIKTFNATAIPFNDNTFDRVFSVSVLEHVPDDGDRGIAKEVARVMRSGSIFVMTAPAGPVYSEEWLKDKNFYWPTKIREDGRAFFQRRYDTSSIRERFGGLDLSIKDIVFIAEKPLKDPELNDNGRFLYNVYYLQKFKSVRILNKITRITQVPALPYFAHRYYSSRCHYLTRDGSDTNIRQVVVKMRKL